MKNNQPTCAACQNSVIEYLTPIEDVFDGPLIYGIDYHFKCKLHDINVDRNHSCTDFELPF